MTAGTRKSHAGAARGPAADPRQHEAADAASTCSGSLARAHTAPTSATGLITPWAYCGADTTTAIVDGPIARSSARTSTR